MEIARRRAPAHTAKRYAVPATPSRTLRAFTVTWQGGEAESAYEFLPSVDFSQQVLSKCTGRLLVLRLTDVGWSDLGHPHRVISTLERAGVAIHRAAALRIGCTASLQLT